VNYPPLSLIRVGVEVTVEESPPPLGDRPWVTRYFVTGPNYFRAAGIQMLIGRDFTAADDATQAGVAIVSETFARRFWNTTDVIGRRVRSEFGQSKAFWVPRSHGGMLTIVGVVRDVREDGLPNAAGLPQLYLPYAQNPTVVVTLIARATRGGAVSTASAIREAVHAVDPALPVSYEMTFDDVLRQTFARPRELAWLIGSFAALALLLSAIGVYGLMAFLTTARAREIAIRMALGAVHGDVLGLVVLDAMKLAAAGVIAGLATTPLTFRFISASVYGVAPWDPGHAHGRVSLSPGRLCSGGGDSCHPRCTRPHCVPDAASQLSKQAKDYLLSLVSYDLPFRDQTDGVTMTVSRDVSIT
jgi:MacB-like periplasmic core domain